MTHPNGHIKRIHEDFALTTNSVKISAPNPKKETQLIKGHDSDKVKRAKYMIQANTIGCQICLDELHRNPKVILKPHNSDVGKKKRKSF